MKTDDIVQFRSVTESGQNKCECGRVIGNYVFWHTEYRVKRGGRWSKWQRLDDGNLPKVAIGG